jgi:hypothetical protein
MTGGSTLKIWDKKFNRVPNIRTMQARKHIILENTKEK